MDTFDWGKVAIGVMLFIWAVGFGYIESLSGTFYGLNYWVAAWGVCFPAMIMIAPVYYWIIIPYKFNIKLISTIALILTVIGLSLITVVVEDFFAVYFAGLVTWEHGMLWSAMGIAYNGVIPPFGDWHTPGFQIPYMYFILIGLGIIFIVISDKYIEPIVKTIIKIKGDKHE